MAEEILVKEYLTKEMIEAGKELLHRLETANFEVVAAFWLYYSEAQEWRLTLAWPLVDKEGPRKAYEKIGEVLDQAGNKISGLGLLNVTVVSPNNTLVRALASASDLIALQGKRLTRSGF